MLPQNSRFLTKEYSGTIEVLSRLIDTIAITLAALLTYLIFQLSEEAVQYLSLLGLIKILVCLIVFREAQLYRSWRGRPYSDQFSRLLLAFIFSGTVVSFVWELLNIENVISFGSLVVWFFFSLALTIAFRLTTYVLIRELRKKGVNQKKIIIYGAGKLGKSLVKQIIKSPESGYQVSAFLDDNIQLWGKPIDSIIVEGGIDKLQSIVGKEQIYELWLTLPLKASGKIETIVSNCSEANVCVRLIPNVLDLTLLNHSVTEFLGYPVIDLNVNRMVGINLTVKIIEDFVLGAFFLILSLPLMLLISSVIYFSSGGPVIFKQKRIGWDGKVFTIYKFRTMVQRANQQKFTRQAKRNDKRITKFGRILRKSSMDELPQIINVLQGRMSIVGPRPHALDHEEEFKKQVKGYARRYMAKPGITGWAQVNDLRGEVKTIEDIRRRLQHDLFYIENWSLWFDIRIILTTLIKIFFSKQAW